MVNLEHSFRLFMIYLFAWLLLNVAVFATCLQHKILLLRKYGVDLSCMLFADFLLTLPFSVNLVPNVSEDFVSAEG